MTANANSMAPSDKIVSKSQSHALVLGFCWRTALGLRRLVAHGIHLDQDASGLLRWTANLLRRGAAHLLSLRARSVSAMAAIMATSKISGGDLATGTGIRCNSKLPKSLLLTRALDRRPQRPGALQTC
jgi:hypothetical protein